MGAVWPHATSVARMRASISSVDRSRRLIDPSPRARGRGRGREEVETPGAPPPATPACAASLARAPRGEPVEISDDVEVLEEIELLDHLILLQQAELASEGRLLGSERFSARFHLESGPHRDEEKDTGDARRQRHRHGAPPPRAPRAASLELLAELGPIAGPVHVRRLSDRANDLVEQVSKLLGVLPAVRALLQMSRDALALGRRELSAQVRHQIGIGMLRHLSASPSSSSGSRARGAGGRARSPPST